VKNLSQQLSVMAVVGMLIGAGCSTTPAELMRLATVSQAQAQQTALAKVPGGVVKEAELEKEHGRLVWSFDISTPGSADITEVQVDAKTGAVVSTETETPEDQEKEAQEDKKAKST
jgi:hypothetical protein